MQLRVTDTFVISGRGTILAPAVDATEIRGSSRDIQATLTLPSGESKTIASRLELTRAAVAGQGAHVTWHVVLPAGEPRPPVGTLVEFEP